MRVSAPGKVVLSGAYSVLEGAPAIVSAVSRVVTADGSRPADFLTPEVKCALQGQPAPWFDASELRGGTQKLGLGSSAAILVASLGARLPGPRISSEQTDEIMRVALKSHAEAQGGGSGIDVMCSAVGSTIIAWHRNHQRVPERVQLPPDLRFQFFSAGKSASTPKLIASVRELKRRDPTHYKRCFAELRLAADRAVQALTNQNAADFRDALRLQGDRLAALGAAAGAPIYTPELLTLRERFQNDAAIYPAGAGGGDIWLYVDFEAPSSEFFDEASGLGQTPLSIDLGAPGLRPIP